MSESQDRDRYSEEEPPVVIRDKRKFGADYNLRPEASGGGAAPGGAHDAAADPVTGPAADQAEGSAQDAQAYIDGELALMDLQTQLGERTADLQRLTAEYANYRKRVERDRVVVGEVATGRVVEAFLPVIDDFERADAHGDLTGAFKSVADKVVDALAKLGLEPFGVVGDPFDPALHEAVMHDESPDVQAPTATTVMRRGYRLGDRLLRPAMVGVTAPSAEPVDTPELG